MLAVALVFFVIVGTGNGQQTRNNGGAHWGRGSRGKAANYKRTSAAYTGEHKPINTGPSLELWATPFSRQSSALHPRRVKRLGLLCPRSTVAACFAPSSGRQAVYCLTVRLVIQWQGVPGQCRGTPCERQGEGGRGAPLPGLALSVPHRCGAEAGIVKERPARGAGGGRLGRPPRPVGEAVRLGVNIRGAPGISQQKRRTKRTKNRRKNRGAPPPVFCQAEATAPA